MTEENLIQYCKDKNIEYTKIDKLQATEILNRICVLVAQYGYDEAQVDIMKVIILLENLTK
jgi:hypothetical protein